MDKNEECNYDERVERMLKRWSLKKIETPESRLQRTRKENANDRGQMLEQEIQEEFIVEKRKVPVSMKC